jgi:hypothetical protein
MFQKTRTPTGGRANFHPAQRLPFKWHTLLIHKSSSKLQETVEDEGLKDATGFECCRNLIILYAKNDFNVFLYGASLQ